MTDPTARIDDVAPGDIIALDRGPGDQAYKVVHKESVESGYLLTLEADDGETFDHQLSSGTRVNRSLESKWESSQTPTPHSPPR
ncbi:hypothetical protein [Mycolicibacterium sp. P1-5]|uniref:hypothetical protein n=1 Tax=Mycolicibacterium sp. P1-5 TaxID=2024617 RepID=UPI0011ED96E8|nr:hypothetical protein [Mycolicibacterium sp. P1-5]KAA0109780.1 hypothetical protein CIW47_09270 [Mycolicibacterium sp. P1-5]